MVRLRVEQPLRRLQALRWFDAYFLHFYLKIFDPSRECDTDAIVCKLRPRANENGNWCGETAESIYERGDGRSIDIVTRRKVHAERMRLPDSRRVSGRGTNARVATTRRARRQRKNNSSVYSKKGTARLRSAEGTFRVHNIYGDGNCLFRAISYILWGNEDEHRSLRTLVTHHIKSHWREYGPFVTAEWNITSPDEYFDFMISEGVFATELECTVATKIYKMNLSIYREINERGDVKRVFHNRLNGSYETARLLFSGLSDSGHYDVLFLDS